MRFYLYFYLLLLLLFYSCDNIDNLNQIAGIEDFGLVIINPAKDSFLKIGEDCSIKWNLSVSKARKLNIELVNDKGVFRSVVQGTANDGEYIWRDVKGVEGDKYSLRLTIVGGVYGGKYAENSIILVKYMPGTIWFEPAKVEAEVGSEFIMELYVNTGKLKLAAYGIDIDFDPSIITVDTTTGMNGVSQGGDGFITAVNADEYGKLRIAGFDTFGTGPGINLHLITIFWITESQGNTDIDLDIRDLSDFLTLPIENKEGIGAKVTVY